ncbi:ABC transporter permease [Micromonospora sp. WMMD980]|uniref:ABC transporter permease n=1 Tax=Micromonospora sp. WMMD980 TaxID=3016088 RepID=UPI002416A3B9|nr:ABC transporter permease [Micromonospora sp. WMMD980]MDG4801391.1 ABC transporter permease [Micromonospora sp. WMMD980]
MTVARGTWLVFHRQISQIIRSPIWIFLSILDPLVYLFLFAPLLQRALNAPTSGAAYTTFVPGLLVLLAIFGGMFAGFNMLVELRAGMIERARVTPMSTVALLLGRSLKDVANLLFQAAIVTLTAMLFGLTVRLPELLLGFLLVGMIALGMSALSNGAALKLKTEGILSPLINTVGHPLLMLSGILLPLALAPVWLQNVANLNVFSWVVRGMRELFAGHPEAPVVWQSFAVLTVLTTLSVYWASRQFARSIR